MSQFDVHWVVHVVQDVGVGAEHVHVPLLLPFFYVELQNSRVLFKIHEVSYFGRGGGRVEDALILIGLSVG